MKTIISIGIILLFLCSCNKENTEVTTLVHKDGISSFKQQTEIQTNPFLTFGQVHNLAMDSVASLSEFPNINASSIYLTITKVLESNFQWYKSTWDVNNNQTLIDSLYQGNDGVFLVLNRYNKDSIFDDTLTNFLEQIVHTALDDTLSMDTSLFDKNISSIEYQIQAQYGRPNVIFGDSLDMNVPNDKSQFLLMVCSIARGSYHYWCKVANDSTNPWYNATPVTTLGFWKWIKKAGADIGGFVTGGVHVSGSGTIDGSGVHVNEIHVKISLSDAIDGASNASAKI